MARERMVTRTVNGYNYTCMTVNPKTQTPGTGIFTLTGVKLDDKHALAEIQKRYTTSDCIPVHILSCDESETLYGMPESEFIRLAKILPPRKDYTTSENDAEG